MIRACRIGILAIILVVLPACNSVLFALNTADIDNVRKKAVLEAADLEVIDSFVDEGLNELMNMEDFSSIGTVRSAIVSRVRPIESIAERQYMPQFLTSAGKYVKAAFEYADQLEDDARREMILLNLLILLDNLQSAELAVLALDMIGHENTAVRYWAVHAVTNSAVVQKLKTEGRGPAKRIATLLVKRIEEEEVPEIVALMVDFAGGVNSPEAEELLLQIADVRMKGYSNWTVEYELMDAAVLKSLCDRISLYERAGTALESQAQKKTQIARRFAQLYSYAMQRYIKGAEVLGETQKHHLATVLVSTEKTCLIKLFGVPQSTIKTAVEKDNYSLLVSEHDSLFGDNNSAGRLAEKFKFSYGQKSDGSNITSPKLLANPPEPAVPEQGG